MLLASHHVSGACMGGRQGVFRWWLVWLGVSSQALMLQLMPSANHRAPQRQPSHRMFGGRHCSGARMGRCEGVNRTHLLSCHARMFPLGH